MDTWSCFPALVSRISLFSSTSSFCMSRRVLLLWLSGPCSAISTSSFADSNVPTKRLAREPFWTMSAQCLPMRSFSRITVASLGSELSGQFVVARTTLRRALSPHSLLKISRFLRAVLSKRFSEMSWRYIIPPITPSSSWLHWCVCVSPSCNSDIYLLTFSSTTFLFPPARTSPILLCQQIPEFRPNTTRCYNVVPALLEQGTRQELLRLGLIHVRPSLFLLVKVY